jgi:succinyl-CoA synthetase beta subunit
MNREEHQGKAVLAAAGIAVPRGRVVTSATEAADAASVGPVVVKAQVPTGKRGKAGGVRFAATPAEAAAAAAALLGSRIGGHPVRAVLVEERLPIERELYAAVTIDPATKGPVVLLSTAGGIDVEDAASRGALRRLPVDILDGCSLEQATALTAGLDLDGRAAAVLVRLYDAWRRSDAELLEINPLAVLPDGSLVAADAKLVVDDAALTRQSLAATLSPHATPAEARAAALGLNFHQLDGPVGVLANGAGLTMATLDMVRHFDGAPANFLEIGGDAYTQAKPALELVLTLPGIRSLVVNFCGAYARTDVMAGGVVDAWRALAPTIPVFFSIHGTGEDAAVALVRLQLGVEPFDRVEDAVQAAVEAAR